MGKLFGWLDRGRKETIRDYDNRINHLEAFHVGYAFLSLGNYIPEIEAFSAYVVWNGEFNAKLEDLMPAGGFMMHCNMEQALAMGAEAVGFPLFARLHARRGRLYIASMMLVDRDHVYDFYFNGCEVMVPERMDLLFSGCRQTENADDAAGFRPEIVTGSRRKSAFGNTSYRRHQKSFGGSYRMLRFGSTSYGSWREMFGGSYRTLRFGGTSYGSWREMLGGSYRTLRLGSTSYGKWWETLGGSYRTLRLGSTSYGKWWEILGGSYRTLWLGSTSYGKWWEMLGGSYRTLWFGSTSYGKWWETFGGSYRTLRPGSTSYGKWWKVIGGSYRQNGGSRGSYLAWQKNAIRFLVDAEAQPEAGVQPGESVEQFLQRPEDDGRRRLIEEMGYGLDLI